MSDQSFFGGAASVIPSKRIVVTNDEATGREIILLNRIHRLDLALEASLRWSYEDTATIVRSGLDPDNRYDEKFIHDIHLIRDGVKAIKECL